MAAGDGAVGCVVEMGGGLVAIGTVSGAAGFGTLASLRVVDGASVLTPCGTVGLFFTASLKVCLFATGSGGCGLSWDK